MVRGGVGNAIQEALDRTQENNSKELPPEIQKILDNPVKESAKMLAEEAKGAAVKGINQVLGMAKEGTAKLQVLIARINTTIGANPEEERKLSDFFIQNAPILGGLENYASGWRRYHLGKERNDPNLQDEGRALCLSALLNLGIDGGTLGVTYVARHIHGALRTVLGAVSLSKVSSALGGFDPVLKTAKALLQNPKTKDRAQKIADLVLEGIQPEPQGHGR
jgi:hypothetical protein